MSYDTISVSPVVRLRGGGHTLLEVIIASTIMFSLVTALLSAWSATTEFSYLVNENLVRLESIERVRTQLGRDLSQSASLVKYDTLTMTAAVDSSTGSSRVLYPVISQDGRELRFVKFRTSDTTSANPEQENTYQANILNTNAQALSAFALANVTPYFIMNPNAGLPGYWNIAPVWDSDRAGLSFAENADSGNLRLWRYVLVPYQSDVPVTIADGTTYVAADYPLYPEAGPTLRRATLLRQYRNARVSEWTTSGPALSDEIVFDSANSEANTTMPCFKFASATDGITRTGSERVGDFEVRLRLTIASGIKPNTPPVLQDLRFSFPFRRIDYGD